MWSAQNPEEGKCNGIFLGATGALLSLWHDTAMKIVKRNMWSTQNLVEGKCNGIFLVATGALLSLWPDTAMKTVKRNIWSKTLWKENVMVFSLG